MSHKKKMNQDLSILSAMAKVHVSLLEILQGPTPQSTRLKHTL